MNKTEAKPRRRARTLDPFDEAIAQLVEELKMAVQWDRPAILFAVYRSHFVMLDAQKALSQPLQELGHECRVVYVNGQDHADIPLVLSSDPQRDTTVFFVQALAAGGTAALTALNIRRDYFAEHRVRVIFWLTEEEERQLAMQAPDFWAVRGRAVYFNQEPKPEQTLKIAEQMLWYSLEEQEWNRDADAKIALRLALLGELPLGDDSLAARAELELALGQLYSAKGECEPADDYLQAAVKHAEELENHRLESAAWSALGHLYFKRGKFRDAMTAYQQAIELDGSAAAPQAGMGHVYHSLDRWEDAKTAFERAIEIDPGNVWAYYGLGTVERARGHFEAAAHAFQRGLAVDEHFTPARIYLAITRFDQGNYSAAVGEFQAAIDLGQLNDAERAELYASIGDAYRAQDRYDLAIAAYQRAIELDPTKQRTVVSQAKRDEG